MKSLRSCSSDCLLQNKLTFTKLAHYSIWSWVTVIPGQSLFKKTAATLSNIVNPNCSKNNNNNNICHDSQEDENALSFKSNEKDIHFLEITEDITTKTSQMKMCWKQNLPCLRANSFGD